MERLSRSEERMAAELISLAARCADDFGVEERFARRLAIDSGNGKRVVTALFGISPEMWRGIFLGGTGVGGIAGLAKLAPATLATLLASIGVGGERLYDWAKRKTGIDPHAGLPSFINDENMADPIWDEPHGSKHIKDIPEYANVPAGKLMEEYDQSREVEENALRDAVRLPTEYSTSGDSSRTLRERYMRPRNVSPESMVPSGAAYSPLDEVSVRMPRSSSGRPKFRRMAQLFESERFDNLINAPDSPFLANAIATSPEHASAMFADRPGIYTPVSQSSPRFLPQGGDGYSPRNGPIKWEAGGTPYETAINKMRAFSSPEYSIPAMTAGAEAIYNSVLLKAKGGVIDPRTARAVIDRFPQELIAAGVPEEVVQHIHSEALARLSSGAGGYDPSKTARYEDMPYGGDFLEDPFSSGRGALVEKIEGSRGRLQDIGKGMGGAAVQQNPMSRGLEMMNA
jgi:hypothetical protein